MRIPRAMMAALIAVSVALLPMAGSAAIAVKPTEQSASDHMHVNSDMSAAMDDCCPDQAKPCDQNDGHCQSMAGCALHSVSIGGVSVSDIQYPLVAEDPLAFLPDSGAPLHDSSPPFRPPRV